MAPILYLGRAPMDFMNAILVTFSSGDREPGTFLWILAGGTLTIMLCGDWIWFARSFVRYRMPLEMPALRPQDLMAVPGNDARFLEDGVRRLKDMGFSHLQDYEYLPIPPDESRAWYSVHSSSDGSVVASLGQSLSPSSALKTFELTTYFESGRSVISSNSPFNVPYLDSRWSILRSPGSLDYEKMVERHRRAIEKVRNRGGTILPVRTIDDYQGIKREVRTASLKEGVDRGFLIIEEGAVAPTRKLAWILYRSILGPFDPTLSFFTHLVVLLVPAAAAWLILWSLFPGPEYSLFPMCLAGTLLGGVYGYFLKSHATFWSALVPSLVVYGLLHQARPAAMAVLGAAYGIRIGTWLKARYEKGLYRRTFATPR